MFKIYHKIFKIISILILYFNYNNAVSDSIKKISILDETLQISDLKLTDYTGKKFLIQDTKTKYFIINFWASWCAPCIKEMKSLDILQKSNTDIRVITISEDKDIQDSKNFFSENKYNNLEKYFDNNKEIISKFSVRGLPTTFIADKELKVFAKVEGIIEWDSEEFRSWLYKN